MVGGRGQLPDGIPGASGPVPLGGAARPPWLVRGHCSRREPSPKGHRMPHRLVPGAVLLSMLSACASAATKPPPMTKPTETPPATISAHQAALAEVARLEAEADKDPLLARWEGPHGGVPPWDKVQTELFPAAFERGLVLLLAEVEAVATDAAPPTFENTIAALENSGRYENRVETLFGVWTDNLSTDEVQAVEREWAPKIAAASDKITFNEKLFARIAAVHAGRES